MFVEFQLLRFVVFQTSFKVTVLGLRSNSFMLLSSLIKVGMCPLTLNNIILKDNIVNMMDSNRFHLVG